MGVGVGVGVGVLVGMEVEVAVGIGVGVVVGAEVGMLVLVAAATKTTCRVCVGSTGLVGVNSTTGGALLQADRATNPPSTSTQR
jgi:hypothetical protein